MKLCHTVNNPLIVLSFSILSIHQICDRLSSSSCFTPSYPTSLSVAISCQLFRDGNITTGKDTCSLWKLFVIVPCGVLTCTFPLRFSMRVSLRYRFIIKLISTLIQSKIPTWLLRTQCSLLSAFLFSSAQLQLSLIHIQMCIRDRSCTVFSF